MIIKLDDDFTDELVGKVLIQNYISLKADIERAETRASWVHEDDVALWKRVVYALEILGDWYVYDFKGKVEEAESHENIQ
jgi:hypothetical protein